MIASARRNLSFTPKRSKARLLSLRCCGGQCKRLADLCHQQRFATLAIAHQPAWSNVADQLVVLKERAIETKKVSSDAKYSDAWTVYPFNSGYFMCVKMNGVDAEELRKHVLHQYGVGVISSGATDIRVAFSCLEVEQIRDVFDALYQAWSDLKS